MRIASLHIHPVKSTAPVDVHRAVVEPWGLADDRRWMVVDAGTGEQVTAREEHRLLTVTANVRGTGSLSLTREGADDLEVRRGPDARRKVSVWDNPVLTTDAGDDAAAWFEALLGREVRLVWLDDPTQRPTNPYTTRPEDRVSLADGYPLMVTNAASLDRLNTWIAEAAVERGEGMPEPLVMRRFRPSAVVQGAEAFAEEGWRRVRIGSLSFRVVKLCDRCVMTTVDPFTLERGKEPIRTLSRYKKWDGKTWFGANLVPDDLGEISVGDPVDVLETR